MKFGILSLLCLSSYLSVSEALWPIPRSLEAGTTSLKLSSDLKITVNVHDAPQDLLDAVNRTRYYLYNDKLGRMVVGRGASDSAGLKIAKTLSSLTLSLTSGSSPARPIATEAVQPIGTREESYSLSVPDDGSGAFLTANSTLGLFRGLSTFEQLWYGYDGVIYTITAPVKIENDAPAFVSIVSSGLGLISY